LAAQLHATERSQGGLSFAAESFERLRVAGSVFRKELQRDEAVEARVLRFVYDTQPQRYT
jgi:hypothetical protein